MVQMKHTARRRLERKFASLRRKEWEQKCCNLNCVDSCRDISDSPRCCLQLVSNLLRKWKWKEKDIKMAIASATSNSHAVFVFRIQTTEILNELSSCSFETRSGSLNTTYPVNCCNKYPVSLLLFTKISSLISASYVYPTFRSNSRKV